MNGHFKLSTSEQGDKGDVGKDGVHGINGTKGDTGEKGANGNVIDTVVQCDVHGSCANSCNTV